MSFHVVFISTPDEMLVGWLVVLVFYGPSTHFESFRAQSVKASLSFKCMTEHLFADFSYSIALDTYL